MVKFLSLILCLTVHLQVAAATPVPCNHASCLSCKAIPNNDVYASDDACSACAPPTLQSWWPCDQEACYCFEVDPSAQSDHRAEPELGECDSATCDNGPSECMCPRNSPPGGLDPSDMPQFIVITIDDAVTSLTVPPIRAFTKEHRNQNGCNIPATWYVSVEYTQADLVSDLFQDGHEIATHTMTHPGYGDAQEIGGARHWLSEHANIPKRAINGFRAPFLLHSERMRSDMRRLGFRYDSSIPESYNAQSETSPSSSARLFPYTMDHGIPQNCQSGTGSCSSSETHAGLWEIPMWTIQGGDDMPITAMDPPTTRETAYTMFAREFDRNYNGNRAPVGLNFHSAFFIGRPERVDYNDGMNAFLEYALSKPNVWVVTVNQLLDFLTDPVPAATFAQQFTQEVQCPAGGYLPNTWGAEEDLEPLTTTPTVEPTQEQHETPTPDQRTTPTDQVVDTTADNAEHAFGAETSTDVEAPATTSEAGEAPATTPEPEPTVMPEAERQCVNTECHDQCEHEEHHFCYAQQPCPSGGCGAFGIREVPCRGGSGACYCPGATYHCEAAAPAPTTAGEVEDVETSTEAVGGGTPADEVVEPSKPEEAVETTAVESVETTAAEAPATTSEAGEAPATTPEPEPTVMPEAERQCVNTECHDQCEHEEHHFCYAQQPCPSGGCGAFGIREVPCRGGSGACYCPGATYHCMDTSSESDGEGAGGDVEAELDESLISEQPAICDQSCTGCFAADNNQGVTDASCAQCADGYAWWPCGSSQLCLCAGGSADVSLALLSQAQESTARSASDAANPGVTSVSWIGAGIGIGALILGTVAFAYTRRQGASATAQEAKAESCPCYSNC